MRISSETLPVGRKLGLSPAAETEIFPNGVISAPYFRAMTNPPASQEKFWITENGMLGTSETYSLQITASARRIILVARARRKRTTGS